MLWSPSLALPLSPPHLPGTPVTRPLSCWPADAPVSAASPGMWHTCHAGRPLSRSTVLGPGRLLRLPQALCRGPADGPSVPCSARAGPPASAVPPPRPALHVRHPPLCRPERYCCGIRVHVQGLWWAEGVWPAQPWRQVGFCKGKRRARDTVLKGSHTGPTWRPPRIVSLSC